MLKYSQYPRLPQELLDNVIDLIDDFDTVKNCSLAGRACRPRCKARLFRKVCLCLSHIDEILDHLGSFDIYDCVRELTIAHMPGDQCLSDEEEASTIHDSDDECDQNIMSTTIESTKRFAEFLSKLTKVERLNFTEGDMGAQWMILPDAFVGHLYSTVTRLCLENVVFPTFEDIPVFLGNFRRLESLVIGDIAWSKGWKVDEERWREKYLIPYSEDSAASAENRPLPPSISLQNLELEEPIGLAILRRFLPSPLIAPELPLRILAIGCENNSDLRELQSLVDRTRKHLRHLQVQLHGSTFSVAKHSYTIHHLRDNFTDEVALRGQKTLDLSLNEQLKRFSCHLNYNCVVEGGTQDTMLNILSTLPAGCEEIHIFDIYGEGYESPESYLSQLDLPKFDGMLSSPRYKAVRLLSFQLKMMTWVDGWHRPERISALDHAEDLRKRASVFLDRQLRRTATRGVRFMITIDDSEAVFFKLP